MRGLGAGACSSAAGDNAGGSRSTPRLNSSGRIDRMAVGVGLGIAARPQASACARRRLSGLGLGYLGCLVRIAACIVLIRALIGSMFAHLTPGRAVAIAIATLATIIVLLVLLDLIASGFILRVIGTDIVTKILVVLHVVALAAIFLEARSGLR